MYLKSCQRYEFKKTPVLQPDKPCEDNFIPSELHTSLVYAIKLFLKFWQTHVLSYGPLVLLFWISGDISSVFQSLSGFCLICFLRRQIYCTFPGIHIWCYTCPPLGDQRTAGHFPTCMYRGGTWLGFEQAITDERATIVPATRLLYAIKCFLLPPANACR